jgi:hypothetical protein
LREVSAATGAKLYDISYRGGRRSEKVRQLPEFWQFGNGSYSVGFFANFRQSRFKIRYFSSQEKQSVRARIARF